MGFIRLIALSIYIVFLAGLVVRSALTECCDIRSTTDVIYTKILEFIGAWILGIGLWMEERVAVCPGR